MTTDRIKFLVVERNGTEIKFPVELLFDAGNMFFDNSTNGWHSDNVQDAIEEAKSDVILMLSYPYYLQAPSNVSNGDLIGRSGTIADKRIILADDIKATKLVWQNNRLNVDFDIELYKNGLAAGNLVHTFVVRSSPAQGGGDVGWGKFAFNINFAEADILYFKYVDYGTNCLDLQMDFMTRKLDVGET